MPSNIDHEIWLEFTKNLPATLEKGALFLGAVVAALTGIGSNIGSWKARAEAKRATDATLVGNAKIEEVAKATDAGNDLTAKAITKVEAIHADVNGQQARRDAETASVTQVAVQATKQAVETSTAAVLVASDVSTDAAKVAADTIAQLQYRIGDLEAQLKAHVEANSKEATPA